MLYWAFQSLGNYQHAQSSREVQIICKMKGAKCYLFQTSQSHCDYAEMQEQAPMANDANEEPRPENAPNINTQIIMARILMLCFIAEHNLPFLGIYILHVFILVIPIYLV